MPISTFPRHDYDEDEYILKTAGLRDTHSEGKVSIRFMHRVVAPLITVVNAVRSTRRDLNLP